MPLLDFAVEGGIATLTLNDPARSNLLSSALCGELIGAVEQANADPQVRAIVIRAAGKSFCAGADLEDLKQAAVGRTAAVQRVYDAFMTVAASPLPTIAVVEGAAVGAGMNLALACDMRIATPGARFDTRFLQIGLHPGGGHGWMLLRAVGWQQATMSLLLGQQLDGEQALRTGLAAACVPQPELAGRLAELLQAVRRTPRELLLRTKQTLRLAARQEHEAAFRHETEQQAWSLGQPAFGDMVAAMQRKLASRREQP